MSLPFEDLAVPWTILFTVALVTIVLMLAWTGVLYFRGLRAYRYPPDAPPEGADAFTWVFLVPALNEELTIRDSVERLVALGLARQRVVVIDDGSDDATPEILGELDQPGLTVIRRDEPHAREGKAAALNHAYRELDSLLGDADRSRVILAVVDADGRLHPDAPRYAASHFALDGVGGVQSLVRIYNRDRVLTWMQDLEFGIYGFLFQAGRNEWSTAGMGGNGQFNLLAALDEVSDEAGPWRDKLTEDQDLGLRLIAAGWRGRQELRATVDQQGLPNLRRLYRQRTRWSQGNLQAMGLIGSIWRTGLPLSPRIEIIAYLLMPFWQGIVGLSLVAAIGLWATGTADFWNSQSILQLAFVYLLGFGGTILGCIAASGREGSGGRVAGFLYGHVYAFYSWLLWPVLLRSAVRQLVDRRDWTKTAREPVAGAEQA